MSKKTIEVRIHGEAKRFEAPLSVAELLQRLELPASGVAVERNRLIVPRAEHAQTQLEDGDDLEIVTLVGGG